MPWTKTNYPNSLKNLEEEVRLKAIDIGNAMMRDGYDEDRAIPIAISKAKDWYEDASSKEKRDLKKKDLTKRGKSDSSSGRLQDADVEVTYREDEKKWEVKSKGAKRADSLFDTKAQAEERAKEIAQYREGEVISHKKNE